MSARVIEFPGQFVAPKKRRIKALAARWVDLMRDPSLADNERERELAERLRASFGMGATADE